MSGRARPEDPLATWCQARLECCTGRAETRHHLAGRLRSAAVPDPDAEDWTRDLCSACHRWVHANPRKARELDLMRSRLRVPYLEDES